MLLENLALIKKWVMIIVQRGGQTPHTLIVYIHHIALFLINIKFSRLAQILNIERL